MAPFKPAVKIGGMPTAIRPDMRRHDDQETLFRSRYSSGDTQFSGKWST